MSFPKKENERKNKLSGLYLGPEPWPLAGVAIDILGDGRTKREAKL